MNEEQLTEFRQQHKHLADRARQAAERAISYRNFQVGCAVLAWSTMWTSAGPSAGYRIFVAANLKPIQDGPKVCAEQAAVSSAIANGAELIIAIVVAGDPQPDSKSGLETPTLHPCWYCRTVLSGLKEVAENTLVLTVQNHAGPEELHTFGDLLKKHKH